MSIKRTIIVTVAIVASVAMVAPALAGADTLSTLQAQLATLTAQIAALQGGSTGTGTGACAGITFSRNLTVGATGSDVKCLQVVLNSKGFTVSATGAGSPGNETSTFGPKTLVAVKKYQAAKGFTPANQVGPLTRQALNADLGSVPVQPGQSPVVNPVGGGLSVSLAFDTPAAQSLAAGATSAGNANFTKISMTAGSGDVSISKIYVTRSGLSLNSDLQNIEVVDAATGVYYGNIASLNSDNRALITFTQPLVITAGSTRSFFLRAGFVTSTSAGKTAMLGIATASDITSNASSVNGGFPVTGNAVTAVSLNIGSLAIAEDGTTVDSKPNVGSTGVILNNFKLTAGSTEDVLVDTISAVKAGTISNNYLANLTLYDVTKGMVVGSVVPSFNVEGKVAFTGLNITIGKGNTERFQVRADIVDGPGLTANADLVDGSNVLVSAKGSVYGFYITPTATGSWAGTGTNNQTVNSGAVTVTKSTLTPATGNISAGDNIPLGTFDFYVVGESVRISKLMLTATLATMTYDQVTAVKVYDENGTIVAGPMDLASGKTVTFTDVFVVPTGTHHYTVKAKIASAVTTGSTIAIGIATGGTTDLTVTGMTSNSTITESGTPTCNTMTVKAGAMDIATNTAAVHSVAKGTKNFIYATASLNAASSGEDVQVTAIGISDVTGADANPDDLQNMTLWADLTPDNSARGDIYETQITNPQQPTSGQSAGGTLATAFTLTRTVVVPKGSFVKVALLADLSTSALTTTSPTHTITFTVASTTATGASTGNSITSTGSALTASGTARAMTNATTGTLSVTKDSSSPVADIILGGQTVTLATFRLAETTNIENLNVIDMTIAPTGTAAVDTYYFYNGSTLLGSVAGGGTTAKLVLSNGQLVVPANGNVLVTVKGLMQTVDGTTVTNGTSVTVNAAGVTSTGASSGSAVNSVDQVAGSTMVLEKARPYFAVSTSPATPSGTLVPNSSAQLAVFDVTNTNGGDDVTFNNTYGRLVFNISKTMSASAGTARTYTLTDGSTTYATVTVSDSTDQVVTFVPGTWSNTLKIPANGSKKLYVYGDTTGFTHQYDVIQLYLSASANNCSYTIGTGTSAQAEGAYVFKGNIYFGSFQHP